MIILELPSHSELLYAEIKRVLRIAADQGFSIPEFASRTTDTLSISIHLPSRLVRCCIDIPDENLDRVVNSDCDTLYVIQYMESTRQHVSLKLHNRIHASIQLFSCIEQDEVCEYWYTPEGEQALTSRISLIHEIEFFKLSHSSWFIALLLLDFPLEDALLVARAATNVSRETWPTQISFFPMLSSSEKEQEDDKRSFYPIDSTMMSLYPVVDDVKWIEKLLQLGIKTVQLRIKNTLQIDLESQITAAINLGHHYQAQVFINDYWQLAIKHGAYGVHLGQDDVISADLLAIKASGLRLGISTHGYWEIINVEQLNPSYIALGHIFPTTTKQMPSQPQGLVRLGLYQKLVNSMSETTEGRMPTVAIGGIDLSNAQAVLNQGVSSLAVVRALTQANDLQQVIQDFNRIFESVGVSHAQEEVSHAYIA